jgi:hypothetical protein
MFLVYQAQPGGLQDISARWGMGRLGRVYRALHNFHAPVAQRGQRYMHQALFFGQAPTIPGMAEPAYGLLGERLTLLIHHLQGLDPPRQRMGG